MCESDLEYVLRWRNHPEIRRCMLSQHEITMTEHQAWFDLASKNEKLALLVIEQDGQPCGCVIFSGVQKNATAEWSFYAAPGHSPGTGTRICSTALDFAFGKLGVHKVAARVLEFNLPSIKIHQRLGFTQEGYFREHNLLNGTYHNLCCFGVLSKEWQIRNKCIKNQ